MSRLINADKLIERLESSPLFNNFGEDGGFIRDFVISLINEFPTEATTHIKNEGHITINIGGAK